jgi:hypothetical protein
VTTILTQGGFVTKESRYWDYKIRFPKEPVEYLKTVKHVLAFHNTAGGYLVFGVKDASFEIEGCEDVPESSVDRLRALTARYAATVDITVRSISYRGKRVAMLHIPRRQDSRPVSIRVEPEQDAERGIFSRGQCLFRTATGSTEVATEAEHWKELLSSGRFGAFEHFTDLPERPALLDHNLPDRQIVCPKFVGRASVLTELWHWLATDHFDSVRMLAGEGGRGKTSLAYEFATQVCAVGAGGIQRVAWFTAKARQFDASRDEYRELAVPTFNDSVSLLRAVGEHFLLDAEELALSRTELLSKLASALQLFPSLLIIDDVDSLEPDEQRAVLTHFVGLGPVSRTRVILTTRQNVSLSSGHCVQVKGLAGAEYDKFVETISARLSVPLPKKGELRKLETITTGSPLFTESIFRLVRSGETLRAALGQWQGHTGEAVRAAAVEKELQRLSTEARRVLLAVALLGDASIAEIVDVVARPRQLVRDALLELQTLFLVGTPEFTHDEPRMRAGDTTQRLLLERASTLVLDHSALATAARKRRGLGDGIYRQRIARGILQAMSQLRLRDYDGAVATAEEMVRRYQVADAHLLFARCLLARHHSDGTKRNDYLTIHDACQRAHNLGCKPELYEIWFNSEWEFGRFTEAREVASLAVSKQVGSVDDWFAMRAAARVRVARGIRSAASHAQAEEEYRAAIADLCEAQATGPESRRTAYSTLKADVENEAGSRGAGRLTS